MNNFLKPIVSFYKKYTHPVEGIYRKKGIRPGADWRMVMSIMFFFGFCLACIHAFMYIGVKNNSWWSVSAESTLSQVTIDQTLLTDVTKRFATQKELLEALNVNPLVVADPSL